MTYGVNAPNGLRPRWTLQGGTFSSTLSSYLIASGYSNAPAVLVPGITYGIFSGDPVRLLADGTIGVGLPGMPMCGTFFGVKYTDAARNFVYSPYWPAGQTLLNSTSVEALIVDAPDTLYDAQSSNSNPTGVDAATLQLGVKQADLNKNANFALGGTAFTDAIVPQNPASGRAVGGQSGFYLDVSTLGEPAGGNLKIIRLTPMQNNGSALVPNFNGNRFYTAPGFVGAGPGNFNNVVVSINNDAFKGGTGTTVVGETYIASGILTPAEINGMFAAAVKPLLIKPIGAGSIIVVRSWSLQTSTGGSVYAGGGNITLRYSGAGANASAAIALGLLTGAAPEAEYQAGLPATVFASASFAKGIEITNAGAPFTGGANNNVHWTIEYTVIAV